MEKHSRTHLVILFLVLLVFGGCAGSSKYMRKVPLDRTSYAPASGKSLVIIMRPSGFAYAIDSSVFDVSSDSDDTNDKLVGIVPAKKKVAYMTEPGEHLFMAVGESADFMKADLKEGKTYYALVTPRMGLWKARFSLKPVRKDQLDSKEFSSWVETCEYIENTEASHHWAKDNWSSIQSKKKGYLEKWNKKSKKDKDDATLWPQDGR